MKKVVGNASGIAGRGGFAGERMRKGETVMQMAGKRMSSEDADELVEAGLLRLDDPFQVGETDYIVLEGVSYLLNHSCEPNIGVRGERELVALRDIRRGEELCYDYATTVGKDEPGEGSWWMKCKCGAKTCRKRVGNWQSLPADRLAYYLRERAVPDYMLAQIAAAARKRGR
jgi:SET domain-containing protein